MILENYADTIALVDLKRRSRGAAPEAPKINRLHRADLLPDHLCYESEDLGVSTHRERQVTNIGGDDGHIEYCFRTSPRLLFARSWTARRFGRKSRPGKDSGTKAKRLLDEGASCVHGNSSFRKG